MDSDWAKAIVGVLFAMFAGIFGVIWRRQDRHEEDNIERFELMGNRMDRLVPREDLQSLVYSSIMQAIRDSNSDFRGEIGRQMGLLAGRLDDVLGQMSRMRDAQIANRQDLIVMATKLGVELPRNGRE